MAILYTGILCRSTKTTGVGRSLGFCSLVPSESQAPASTAVCAAVDHEYAARAQIPENMYAAPPANNTAFEIPDA